MMKLPEIELPAARTPYGQRVVSAYRQVERIAHAVVQGFGGDDVPEALRDGADAIRLATLRATRDLLNHEGDLTSSGLQKRWRDVVADQFMAGVQDGEHVKQAIEARVAASEADAARVELPPLSGESAVIRELRHAERRRYLAERERETPGTVYAAVVAAAATGGDDELLAVVEQAPPESGVRLNAQQRDAVRTALVRRRAPFTGDDNRHATSLEHVLREARTFAKVAANNPDA